MKTVLYALRAALTPCVPGRYAGVLRRYTDGVRAVHWSEMRSSEALQDAHCASERYADRKCSDDGLMPRFTACYLLDTQCLIRSHSLLTYTSQISSWFAPLRRYRELWKTDKPKDMSEGIMDELQRSDHPFIVRGAGPIIARTVSVVPVAARRWVTYLMVHSRYPCGSPSTLKAHLR